MLKQTERQVGVDIPPWRRILYSILVVVAIFGTPELLLRLFWTPPAPTESGEQETRRFVSWLSELAAGKNRSAELYRDDRELLWSLKPGVRIDTWNYHRGERGELQPVRITINPEGYRGEVVAARKADPQGVRVLCMGDSNFFGYPLDDADVFPRTLAAAMERNAPNKKVTIINGGVPGYTVLQGRRLYERMFSKHEYDWLLLSYLNNDAWLQPREDRELFRAQDSVAGRIAKIGNSVHLVRFAQSVLPQRVVPTERKVPRVSLEEFVAAYREFIAAARVRGARVMILDYRGYSRYEPYSTALRELATAEKIGYVYVAELAIASLASGQPEGRYASLCDGVLRRWGAATLKQRPYLWYYAEYNPEHLNEVGAAWLAETVAPALLRETP